MFPVVYSECETDSLPKCPHCIFRTGREVLVCFRCNFMQFVGLKIEKKFVANPVNRALNNPSRKDITNCLGQSECCTADRPLLGAKDAPIFREGLKSPLVKKRVIRGVRTCDSFLCLLPIVSICFIALVVSGLFLSLLLRHSCVSYTEDEPKKHRPRKRKVRCRCFLFCSFLFFGQCQGAFLSRFHFGILWKGCRSRQALFVTFDSKGVGGPDWRGGGGGGGREERAEPAVHRPMMSSEHYWLFDCSPRSISHYPSPLRQFFSFNLSNPPWHIRLPVVGTGLRVASCQSPPHPHPHV